MARPIDYKQKEFDQFIDSLDRLLVLGENKAFLKGQLSRLNMFACRLLTSRIESILAAEKIVTQVESNIPTTDQTVAIKLEPEVAHGLVVEPGFTQKSIPCAEEPANVNPKDPININ